MSTQLAGDHSTGTAASKRGPGGLRAHHPPAAGVAQRDGRPRRGAHRRSRTYAGEAMTRGLPLVPPGPRATWRDHQRIASQGG